MRAFVAIRQLVVQPSAGHTVAEVQQEIKDLKLYIEEVFADYNDINEDTRIQLELINRTLAELQVHKKMEKQRIPVGFIKPDDSIL